ncbi:MAG TPA: DUF6510 family protein [Jatrophihabitantaceae bacterium]|jgi:hypothetical protein
MTHLDGNAAGGELGEIFAVDVTAATGQCLGCGRVAPVATALAYGQAPGLVLRCPGCDEVLIRVVTAPGRTWLDVRGLAYLQFVE